MRKCWGRGLKNASPDLRLSPSFTPKNFSTPQFALLLSTPFLARFFTMTTMTQTQAMTQTQGTTVTSVTPVTKKPRYPRRALLAEVQVVDGKEEELSKAILFQVKPWDETEYGASERLTGNRLAMCGIQQGEIFFSSIYVVSPLLPPNTFR